MNNKDEIITWEKWLKSKGLKEDDVVDGGHYEDVRAQYFKEIGLTPTASEAAQKIWGESDRKEKEIERYVPLILTVVILVLNSVANFLSDGWKLTLLFALGVEVVIIFIHKTVKEAIRENKKRGKD